MPPADGVAYYMDYCSALSDGTHKLYKANSYETALTQPSLLDVLCAIVLGHPMSSRPRIVDSRPGWVGASARKGHA